MIFVHILTEIQVGHPAMQSPSLMQDMQLNFLFEYAEIHAPLLPGRSRVPGYKWTDLQVYTCKCECTMYMYAHEILVPQQPCIVLPQLLPFSTTKRDVWLVYAEACERAQQSHLPIQHFADCGAIRFLVSSS